MITLERLRVLVRRCFKRMGLWRVALTVATGEVRVTPMKVATFPLGKAVAIRDVCGPEVDPDYSKDPDEIWAFASAVDPIHAIERVMNVIYLKLAEERSTDV
jgi:hypothetical protein